MDFLLNTLVFVGVSVSLGVPLGMLLFAISEWKERKSEREDR